MKREGICVNKNRTLNLTVFFSFFSDQKWLRNEFANPFTYTAACLPILVICANLAGTKSSIIPYPSAIMHHVLCIVAGQLHRFPSR